MTAADVRQWPHTHPLDPPYGLAWHLASSKSTTTSALSSLRLKGWLSSNMIARSLLSEGEPCCWSPMVSGIVATTGRRRRSHHRQIFAASNATPRSRAAYASRPRQINLG
jgi:hypothetical protein